MENLLASFPYRTFSETLAVRILTSLIYLPIKSSQNVENNKAEIIIFLIGNMSYFDTAEHANEILSANYFSHIEIFSKFMTLRGDQLKMRQIYIRHINLT